MNAQVLVLTAAQLACCGMLLQQPLLSSQGTGVQNMCLHGEARNRMTTRHVGFGNDMVCRFAAKMQMRAT